MELLLKLRQVSQVLLAKRKISNVPTGNVNIVCTHTASSRVETGTNGEYESHTPVEILTVNNNTQLFHCRNENLSIADDVLGDISLFVQSRHGESEQSVEATEEDNGLNATTEAENISIAIYCTENQDQDSIEIVQAPETVELDTKKSTSKIILEVALSHGEPVTRTDVKYKPSVYIHTHFDLMYICGTCAYRTFIPISTAGRENRLHWTKTRIQMVINLFVNLVRSTY